MNTVTTDVASIRVLLIEDDADVRASTLQALDLAGIDAVGFDSVHAAQLHVKLGAPVVLVCDVLLPGRSGVEWLPEVRAIDPDLPVILITGHGHIAMAVQAMRDGAYDFIEKPFDRQRLCAVVQHAVDRRRLTLQVRELREALENWCGIEATLLGRSPQMERVRRTVLSLASTSADVLIYGETGTGKEVVARCLHEHSSRRHAHFVPVNCGGLPESLVESELFGHEAGAFTGASRVRIGKFEHADRGTLFLDEIESMPVALQVKLLRALQDRSIERLGSNKAVRVDCRVVAASQQGLRALADKQQFRADLYYRIGVAIIELPPLRERREDIPLLFEHFCLLAASRYERSVPVVTSAQMAELLACAWPGNVRELRNVADRFVLGLLPGRLTEAAIDNAAGVPRSLPQQMDAYERALIVEQLRRHRGDQAAAAQELGIPRQTLNDKLRRLGIDVARFK